MIQPLVGKQAQSVALATHRLNLWEGSVRSSKTVSSLLWWIRYVRTGPAGNLAMIGKTERTLKRNIIDPLIDMLGSKRCKANWGDGELMLLGRRVYLAGANNEAAVGKIQGLTLAGAYVDECTLLPESFWAMLLSRLSVEGAQLGGTMNPDNPRHWMMRDNLERAAVWLKHDGTVVTSEDPGALDLARFSFNLRDNPSLPAGYVDALTREFTGLWRLRFIEGLWVLAEGAIFDAFDPTPGAGHVVTTLPDIDRWVLCIDYGTTNPFVALLLGLGTDDRLYVAREWRWDSRAKRAQRTDAQYSADLRAWLDELDPEGLDISPLRGARNPEWIFVDPSAASFAVQMHHDQWTGVMGADNSVANGIRSVSSLLASGRLRIHHTCTGLIDEMVGYVWDKKAAEKGVEQPLKVDDHGPDALRYGVMGTRRWWTHWMSVPLDDAA